MQTNKNKPLFGGILTIFMFWMAYDTYINKALNVYYGYYIKLENMYVFVVGVFVIFGIYSLYRTFSKDSNIQESEIIIEHSICPNCEETFNHVDLKDGMCPYCEDVKTEDLDGYYKKKKEVEDNNM
jgi:hypothetical protein